MTIKRFVALAVLCIPLAFVANGAIVLTLSSPWDWSGRTEYAYRLPYWAASLSPLMISAPAFVLVAWSFKDLLRSTRGLFRFGPVNIILGGLALCFGGLILLGVSHDPYRTFSYTSIYGTEPPDKWGTTALGSLFTTLVIMGFVGGPFCGAAFLYCKGVISEGSGRYDKRKGEVDATGVLLQELDSEKAASRR